MAHIGITLRPVVPGMNKPIFWEGDGGLKISSVKIGV